MRAPVLLACTLCCLLLLTPCTADDVVEALTIEAAERVKDTCAVKDQGAVGDGRTKDTTAIQKAIDECSQKANGGIVAFEAGKKYLSGQLSVRSKATLMLPPSTSLLASSEMDDYPSKRADWYFMLIANSMQVTIEGGGIISGQSPSWISKAFANELKQWEHASCTSNTICRPHLIGVRNSSQVTFSDLQIKDAVHFGLHILNSEAVAIVDTVVMGQKDVPEGDGIVVDGSRRVFVGNSKIYTSGTSIAAKTTGKKALESLLIDHVQLKSETAAINLGPEVNAEIRTVVIQEADIQSSHRGIGIQLAGSADIHDCWFTNVTVTSSHMSNTFEGAAEPIHVSVKPREKGAPIGKASNIWFTNVVATSEGGIVLSGDSGATIEGITLKNVSLEMTKQTNLAWDGGFRDFRPSHMGVQQTSAIPAIFLEHANQVTLENVEVVWGTPGRSEWGNLLDITPHTVHSLHVEGFSLHDEAAHPSGSSKSSVAPVLADFRSKVTKWVKSIQAKGFISSQENAAPGVMGRRAASSASPLIIVLLAVVVIALLTRYVCYPLVLHRRLPSRHRRAAVV